MLKRLWVIVSLGWALVMLGGMWFERDQSLETWLAAFAVAFAPFAAIPIGKWIWAGRKRAAAK